MVPGHKYLFMQDLLLEVFIRNLLWYNVYLLALHLLRLPVLAGANGALGAYCPPYISVDGAYHASSGQTTSARSSRSAFCLDHSFYFLG